jgi:hypothetical protein
VVPPGHRLLCHTPPTYKEFPKSNRAAALLAYTVSFHASNAYLGTVLLALVIETLVVLP